MGIIKEKLVRKLVLGRLLTFTQLSYESLIKCTVFDPCHVVYYFTPIFSNTCTFYRIVSQRVLGRPNSDTLLKF